MKVLILNKYALKYKEELKKYNKEDIFIACPQDNPPEELLSEIEIIFCWKIPENLLAYAKHLKWIQLMGAGAEHILKLPSLRSDIIITATKGIQAEAISEYVMSYILAFANNLFAYKNLQKEKNWMRLPRFTLAGRHLAILGLGHLGKAIARKASVFNMKIWGTKLHPEPVEFVEKVFPPEKLQELLKFAHFLVLTLPLTSATRGIINKETISYLSTKSYIINVSRGEVIIEEDLIEALSKGKLAGAVLDVFTREPLPVDSPLWECKNLYITPHISWWSEGYIKETCKIFLKNLSLYKQNKPLIYCVDRELGY